MFVNMTYLNVSKSYDFVAIYFTQLVQLPVFRQISQPYQKEFQKKLN